MVEKNAAVTSLPTGRMVIVVGALTASLYWNRTHLGVGVGGRGCHHPSANNRGVTETGSPTK